MDLQQLIQDQALEMFKGKATEMLGETVANNANLEGILGMVAGQIGKNSANEEGANGLMAALEKHTAEGVNIDLADGQKILSHLFGGDTGTIQQNLAKKSNLSSGQSNDLLSLAASLVMENLGNAKASGNLQSSQLSGLSGLATSFLDKDKDGSIIDDILNMIKNLLFRKK